MPNQVLQSYGHRHVVYKFFVSKLNIFVSQHLCHNSLTLIQPMPSSPNVLFFVASQPTSLIGRHLFPPRKYTCTFSLPQETHNGSNHGSQIPIEVLFVATNSTYNVLIFAITSSFFIQIPILTNKKYKRNASSYYGFTFLTNMLAPSFIKRV